MERVLVIDQGQTLCRVELYEGGVKIDSAEGHGPTTPRHGEEWRRGMLQGFDQALEHLSRRPDSVDALCIGSNYARMTAAQAEMLHGAVSSIVSSKRTIVTDDVVTSYAGALGYTAGIVVTLGTGIVALSCDGVGGCRYVNGWGYILGDQGSGYSVGQKALASAMMAYDGRGGSGELLKRAQKKFGPIDGIMTGVYGASNPVRLVASFVPDVVEAARCGDSFAQAIWEQTVADIAANIVALASTFPQGTTIPVSWSGEMFKIDDLILEPLLLTLSERLSNISPRQPLGSALEGGRRLAVLPESHFFGEAVYVFNT